MHSVLWNAALPAKAASSRQYYYAGVSTVSQIPSPALCLRLPVLQNKDAHSHSCCSLVERPMVVKHILDMGMDPDGNLAEQQ